MRPRRGFTPGSTGLLREHRPPQGAQASSFLSNPRAPNCQAAGCTQLSKLRSRGGWSPHMSSIHVSPRATALRPQHNCQSPLWPLPTEGRMVLPITKMGLPENSLASDWPALWPLHHRPRPWGPFSLPVLHLQDGAYRPISQRKERRPRLEPRTSGTNTEWGSPCWHLRARELPRGLTVNSERGGESWGCLSGCSNSLGTILGFF